MALRDALEFRFGKGVIGKWASGWFCLQNGQLLQYGLDEDDKGQEAKRVFDLIDANEFNYDVEKGGMTLQCGNERIRFRGPPEKLRTWYEHMRAVVPKEVQPSATFQPPVRVELPASEGGSPRPRSRTSRASFFNKPLEHLKSNERLDPQVATTMSRPTQMLLSIYYQMDANKLRTTDLVRRVDINGDGELSRHELRKGLQEILGFTCSNDDFKELMRVLDADQSDSISCKEMDRALKKAAKGEDLMVEVEAEAILHDAMLQVDTVVNIPITAETGDSMYVAYAKWKGEEKGKPPRTEARPGRISGAAAEDCAIRQQLKLVAKKNSPEVAILSICRRDGDDEELIGQCMMNVHSEEHHDVHWLKLLDAQGLQTGVEVRLRVKLKVQKPHLAKTPTLTKMDSQASLSPRSPRAEQPKAQRRFEKMHQLHAERQQKMEDKRKAMEAEQLQKLAEEAQSLKSKRVKAAELCPRAAADRLYRDSKARMRRRREHQYAHYQQEEENMLKSKQESRQFWSRSLDNAELVSSVNAGMRLHDKAINKQLQMQQKMKEKTEAEVKDAKDLASKTIKRASSVGAVEPERLYKEAQQKMKQKAEEREKKDAEELKKFRDQVVGRGRSVNLKRVEELHLEHQDREQKRALQRDEQRKREDERVNQEIEQGRQRARLNKDKNRKLSPKTKVPWHERLTQPKQKPEDPTAKPPQMPKPVQRSTGADYILDGLSSVLKLRCFSAGAEKDRKILLEPLKAILDSYKQALAQCNKIEGFSSLASRPSLRLYPDGHLLEDSAGWQSVSEPGPIRQVQDSLEDLMATAERAQVMLENLIAPKEGKEWRPGEQRQKPSAVPMASFAYSYGVKLTEAARTKALVRFGPAEGERRFRHILDLARIGLVFLNCDFLQHGLDLILSQFEVVDVRNGFRNPLRSGERYVEVLVILEVEQEQGEPIPHVCEIRLEEVNFYNARLRAEPSLQELLSRITQQYSSKNPGLMGYLARWTLSSQCPSHGLRVWKTHLTKKFGSVVGAWRQKFGLVRLVPYSKFRDLCKETKSWPHATEYWQELDIGMGGSISLFELDPQTICMLAIFRARLLKLAGSAEPSAEELWYRLTLCLNGQLQRSDRMIISEFSLALTRALGFSTTEAKLIFDALDSEGGQTFNPPGHVRQADITWLSKMQLLVDLDAIALRPGGFAEAPRSSSGALRATPGSPTSEDEAPGTPSVPSVPATPATLDSVPPTPEPPRAEPKVEPKAEPRAEPRPKAEPALKVEPAPVAPVAVEPKAEAKARPREEPVTASKSVTLQPEPEVQEMEVDDHSDFGEDGEEEEEEEDFEMDLSAHQELPSGLEDETF